MIAIKPKACMVTYIQYANVRDMQPKWCLYLLAAKIIRQLCWYDVKSDLNEM